MVEDACQAHGTSWDNKPVGTFGDLGCFSTKDGKLLWSGEGGFILTADADLAARCRAYRSHWLTPPAGQAPMQHLGHNYRLADPLAALARHNLGRIDQLLTRRREQTAILTAVLDNVAGLRPCTSRPDEHWNRYAPLARIDLPRPREFCRHLAALGVPNSVGTFGLVSADQRLPFAEHRPAPCPWAARLIDTTLALVITDRTSYDQIRRIGATIIEEVHRWPHA